TFAMASGWPEAEENSAKFAARTQIPMKLHEAMTQQRWRSTVAPRRITTILPFRGLKSTATFRASLREARRGLEVCARGAGAPRSGTVRAPPSPGEGRVV